MTKGDVYYIISLTLKAMLFIGFIYLDRKTWSWMKIFCVVGLIEYNTGIQDVSGYSLLYLLFIYSVTVILTFIILNREKNTVS